MNDSSIEFIIEVNIGSIESSIMELLNLYDISSETFVLFSSNFMTPWALELCHK